MKYITDNKIEDLRSKEEYFVELLLIGLIIEEYRDNSRAFKSVSNKRFLILNNLRKIKYLKIFIDNFRGYLISKILLKKKYESEEISLEDIALIIKWLDASGDFDEEVLRLNNWKTF